MATLKPYRLKHVPTDLYYQPHKYRGSSFSTKGKIYQTNGNGLSGEKETFTIYCAKDSLVFKKIKDVISWTASGHMQMRIETLTKDWIKEEL